MEDKFIVAEISKNWHPGDTENASLLCKRFEKVININLSRGYKLIDWKTSVCVNAEIMNETIIAIFEKIITGQPALQNPLIKEPEWIKTVEGIETEVKASMLMLPAGDYKNGWNNAMQKVLKLIDNYKRGEGLFQ